MLCCLPLRGQRTWSARFCGVFVVLVGAQPLGASASVVPQGGSAAHSPRTCPDVSTRRDPFAAPSSSRSRGPRCRCPLRCRPVRGGAPASPKRRRSLPVATRRAATTTTTTTTGTCAATSAPPAPAAAAAAAPSSDRSRARRKHRLSAKELEEQAKQMAEQRLSGQEVEEKVMRLAKQRHSAVARDVLRFQKEIRSRPWRQPDPVGGWRQCLVDTRRKMDDLRGYLAVELETSINEEVLDALERCVERLVYEPLVTELYQRAVLGLSGEECFRDMQRLVARHREVGVPCTDMGAMPLSPEARDRVRRHIHDMGKAKLPSEKLHHLSKAVTEAAKLAHEENEITICADNLVPLMSWMLVDSYYSYALTDAEVLSKLLPEEIMSGMGGYNIITLMGAARYINSSLDHPKATAISTPVAPAVTNACEAATETDCEDACDKAAEVTNSAGSDDMMPLEILPAVMIPSDDEQQKPEPLEDNSDSVFHSVKTDTIDCDSGFGDDRLSFQSLSSLSSTADWKSVDDTWCMSRSYSDLSTYSSNESLPESESADSKVAQLDSVGTLFSTIPVFLPKAVMV